MNMNEVTVEKSGAFIGGLAGVVAGGVAGFVLGGITGAVTGESDVLSGCVQGILTGTLAGVGIGGVCGALVERKPKIKRGGDGEAGLYDLRQEDVLESAERWTPVEMPVWGGWRFFKIWVEMR